MSSQTRKPMEHESGSVERETLHDFSIEFIKVMAETFGWRVKTSKGRQKGPDLVIEHLPYDAESPPFSNANRNRGRS